MSVSDRADFTREFGFSAGFVEKMYADYLNAPETVGEEWRRYFDGRRAGVATAPPPVAVPSKAQQPPPVAGMEPLRGVAARIAENMAESLSVPTATSLREIPVKVLEENRRIINHHLAADYRGKASYTHMVAWAMVRALAQHPAMAVSFVTQDAMAFRRQASAINLGIAIDIARPDGQRTLVVPNIKDCAALDFAGFLQAFNDVIARARKGKLTPRDFRDTTCTLTNPGMIGTVSSLPRLMADQSFILATGAIAVPAAYQGAATATLTELGISKVMTVTNTYDHRVIQGAESGAFLATIHTLLTGEQDFYHGIFTDLKIPHQPMLFSQDRRAAPGSPLRDVENMERAAKVMQYIRAYRVRGYLLADLDPLEYEPKIFPELEMTHYGLTIWDLDREFFTGGATGRPIDTLRRIREVLEETYCRRIGVEFMHIADPEQKEWLRSRMEGHRNQEELPKERLLRVLDKLVEAEAFERFLHTRFVGHKRFSIEGAETLIPALNALLIRAAESGVQRVMMGMAHRGRLNVLAHIMAKPLTRIFSEFEGRLDPETIQGSGDVKYHLGSRGTFTTPEGQNVEIELASNPSHLEAVDPVVEGMARARQTVAEERQRVLPVLIHGDAAFSGQGVVAETLNMSQLRGYRTGGTVHLIVNNQIGYTTLPADARSTPYCTDVAKAIQAPIFHVNGDDPLAAVRMVRLALDYRQRFERDVVVDIVCYRRHGHNEGDEPSYTQPLLYKKIEAHPSVREIYQDYLMRAGVLDTAEAQSFDDALQQHLRAALEEVRSSRPPEIVPPPEIAESWAQIDTAVPAEQLVALAGTLGDLPPEFTPHPKVARLLARRREMVRGQVPMDFGLAETLAFASLVEQGVPVRLAGQDSGRATFSQRHAVLLDCETGEKRIPLQFVRPGQASFLVVDSLLSEEAALGFEYGYAVACLDGLNLWEAQFGDFVNGAQIQIDQFLAAGEAKWRQPCGLVLLLPHGYDGQGPEHSSARLERFLQLCAQNNMRVANPTTPAQYFHLLRRQALDPVRKPLIVMTTKSLLRLKQAGSSVDELASGTFQPVMADPVVTGPARRVVLCSGKVYYDLIDERSSAAIDDVAIVRVEQLYPWPADEITAAIRRAGDAELVWCQEEPRNMGAFVHVWQRLPSARYVGRPASGSPATGSLHRHKASQSVLVREAVR